MRTTQKGVTLMELIVVMIIIGTMAMLTVPRYQMVIERARSSEAIQILTVLHHAQKRYAIENNGTNG